LLVLLLLLLLLVVVVVAAAFPRAVKGALRIFSNRWQGWQNQAQGLSFNNDL